MPRDPAVMSRQLYHALRARDAKVGAPSAPAPLSAAQASATVLDSAESVPPEFSDDALAVEFTGGGPKAKGTKTEPPAAEREARRATALKWSDLADKEPPARRWAIKGWLGMGHSTLAVGVAGIGKTLLAQQVASALALGQYFIDDVPGALKVLMWCCEDDHDELWRRQLAIAKWLGAGFDAFAENLIIQPRHGLENTLVATEFGRLMFTTLIEELREQAGDYRAEVVILDNAAQLYGGNENDKHHVTLFMNALAGALPGRAILLLAHPARALGSEFSGSSAWENVARTRLYLGAKLPGEKLDPADDEPAEDVRFLARRKANYSSRDWRRFLYKDGVLVPDAAEAAGSAGGMVGYLRDQQAERIVLESLEKLRSMGIDATESTSSPNYLPKLITNYGFHEGRSRQEIASAMRRLRVDRRLERAVVGEYANRTKKYGLRPSVEVHK